MVDFSTNLLDRLITLDRQMGENSPMQVLNEQFYTYGSEYRLITLDGDGDQWADLIVVVSEAENIAVAFHKDSLEFAELLDGSGSGIRLESLEKFFQTEGPLGTSRFLSKLPNHNDLTKLKIKYAAEAFENSLTLENAAKMGLSVAGLIGISTLVMVGGAVVLTLLFPPAGFAAALAVTAPATELLVIGGMSAMAGYQMAKQWGEADGMIEVGYQTKNPLLVEKGLQTWGAGAAEAMWTIATTGLFKGTRYLLKTGAPAEIESDIATGPVVEMEFVNGRWQAKGASSSLPVLSTETPAVSPIYLLHENGLVIGLVPTGVAAQFFLINEAGSFIGTVKRNGDDLGVTVAEGEDAEAVLQLVRSYFGLDTLRVILPEDGNDTQRYQQAASISQPKTVVLDKPDNPEYEVNKDKIRAAAEKARAQEQDPEAQKKGYFLDRGIEKSDQFTMITPFGKIVENIESAIAAKRAKGDLTPARLLTIGAGKGKLELELKQKFGPDIQIDTFSLTSELTPEAREAVRREYLGNIDIQNLPTGYDRILSIWGSYHAWDQPRAVEQIAEALNPGGEAVFITQTNSQATERFLKPSWALRDFCYRRGFELAYTEGWMAALGIPVYLRKGESAKPLDLKRLPGPDDPAHQEWNFYLQVRAGEPYRVIDPKNATETTRAIIRETCLRMLREAGYDVEAILGLDQNIIDNIVQTRDIAVLNGMPVEQMIRLRLTVNPDPALERYRTVKADPSDEIGHSDSKLPDLSRLPRWCRFWLKGHEAPVGLREIYGRLPNSAKVNLLRHLPHYWDGKRMKPEDKRELFEKALAAVLNEAYLAVASAIVKTQLDPANPADQSFAEVIRPVVHDAQELILIFDFSSYWNNMDAFFGSKGLSISWETFKAAVDQAKQMLAPMFPRPAGKAEEAASFSKDLNASKPPAWLQPYFEANPEYLIFYDILPQWAQAKLLQDFSIESDINAVKDQDPGETFRLWLAQYVINQFSPVNSIPDMSDEGTYKAGDPKDQADAQMDLEQVRRVQTLIDTLKNSPYSPDIGVALGLKINWDYLVLRTTQADKILTDYLKSLIPEAEPLDVVPKTPDDIKAALRGITKSPKAEEMCRILVEDRAQGGPSGEVTVLLQASKNGKLQEVLNWLKAGASVMLYEENPLKRESLQSALSQYPQYAGRWRVGTADSLPGMRFDIVAATDLPQESTPDLLKDLKPDGIVVIQSGYPLDHMQLALGHPSVQTLLYNDNVNPDTAIFDTRRLTDQRTELFIGRFTSPDNEAK